MLRNIASPLLVGVVYGLAALARPLPADAQEPSSVSRSAALAHCLVTAIDDVQIPALRTGQLISVLCQEGAHVEAGAVVAQIDDTEAAHQADSAEAERAAAHKKAESLLEEQFAQATHDVSQAEHDAALDANKKFANSVSDIEVLRLSLAVKQAALRVELSRFNRGVLAVELGGVDARAKLAKVDVERRRLKAPISGEIAEIAYRPGEWVEAGAPVVRIVRLEELRVEGFLKVRDFSPAAVVGKPVRVEIELSEGKRHAFDGKITFVSPVIDAGSQFRVWAEVANRKENDQWLLRPGLQAQMTINP